MKRGLRHHLLLTSIVDLESQINSNKLSSRIQISLMQFGSSPWKAALRDATLRHVNKLILYLDSVCNACAEHYGHHCAASAHLTSLTLRGHTNQCLHKPSLFCYFVLCLAFGPFDNLCCYPAMAFWCFSRLRSYLGPPPLTQ